MSSGLARIRFMTTEPGRRYAGKTLEQRRAERHGRLLDAGLELFATQGFTQTTIEQLCATAGLNPRYFYEQFASREELLAAVYCRHVDAVEASVRRALARAPADPRARLQAGLRAFLEGTLADERGARINYFEIVGVSHELERLRRRALGAYAELIAEQIEELGTPLRAPHRRLVAVALVGATDGLVIDWLSGDRRYAREAILTTLLGLFESLLGES